MIQAIASIRCRRQSDYVASVCVCRAHTYSSVGLLRVVGKVVLGQLTEVCRVCRIACHSNRARICCYVIIPLVKSVAVVGCSGQRALGIIIIGACTAYSTSSRWCHIGVDSIFCAARNINSAQICHLIISEHAERELVASV